MQQDFRIKPLQQIGLVILRLRRAQADEKIRSSAIRRRQARLKQSITNSFRGAVLIWSFQKIADPTGRLEIQLLVCINGSKPMQQGFRK